MDVGVGTFNLNNLFSRFTFRADIETTTPANPGIAGVSGMAAGTTAAPTEEPMASSAFGDGSLFVLSGGQGGRREAARRPGERPGIHARSTYARRSPAGTMVGCLITTASERLRQA
ncbi:MAG: hypothetical protein ACRDJH_25535 [Thermomicrobiales bacterium]